MNDNFQFANGVCGYYTVEANNMVHMKILERSGVKLVNITINVPDQVGEAINQRHDRENLDLQGLIDIFERYKEPSEKIKTINRPWAW